MRPLYSLPLVNPEEPRYNRPNVGDRIRSRATRLPGTRARYRPVERTAGRAG